MEKTRNKLVISFRWKAILSSMMRFHDVLWDRNHSFVQQSHTVRTPDLPIIQQLSGLQEEASRFCNGGLQQHLCLTTGRKHKSIHGALPLYDKINDFDFILKGDNLMRLLGDMLRKKPIHGTVEKEKRNVCRCCHCTVNAECFAMMKTASDRELRPSAVLVTAVTVLQRHLPRIWQLL